MAKLKFSMIFKSLKPMWFIMIFLFIVNLFVYKDNPNDILVDWWIFEIHLQAITQTLKIVLRLALLITLSTLFTATTKPLDITVAIDDLFAWLKVFKINVHILSMTISIALRFIPTILDETYRIMKAQASRGVDFKNGKLKEKVVAISSLIIPLFVSSISRSDELANAMEARNYNPLAKRSRYRNLKWTLKDSISLTISILTLGVSITSLILMNNVFDYVLTDTFFKDIIVNIINYIKGWF
jgi:energy-coupling factor transport system permease protein